MPEDVLTYKVEVDAADLPQQLEQLRGQMDMALGSMAFGSAPPPPEMTSSPMNFMFNSAPDVGMQHMIDSTSQGFLATSQGMAQQEGSGLMSFLNSNVEAFRLGYGKFHSGMERMGLMVPPSPLVQFPMQGMSAYGEQAAHLQQLGLPGGPLFTATGMEQAAAHMPGLIPGAFGLGYDPDTMPMSRFEFQEAYGEAAGARTRNFVEGNSFTMGGAALGSIIPGVGTVAGAAAGMATDAILGWAGGRRRQNEQVGKALQRISQHSGMQRQFTKDEGADLAGELLGQADTYDARVNRVTRDSIQSQLLDFTEAGGFDQTATAEEFKATAQGVIDNTRKIMQTLRMTQEEATTFMAEMNREGLVNTNDSAGFAMNIAAQAKVSGLDPTMMLNEVRAGAEMFRGSAYEMGGGMQMLMDARVTTQSMLQNTPGGQDIIRELGGIQQASMGLAQRNANFMQTGMGMLAYNNAMQGGAGNDTMAMLGNAAGMSPFDWYAQRARMANDVASGDISQQDVAGFRLDPILNMYEKQFRRTEGRGMGVDDFEGFFQFTTQAGFTENVAEARQLFATRFADPEEGTRRNIEALNSQLDKMRQPEPVSIFQKMSAQLGTIGDALVQPFRDAEKAFHESWDGFENWAGDLYLDRQRFEMDNTTDVHNELQSQIAERTRGGKLTNEESTFLAEVKEEYLGHIKTTGMLSGDRYLKPIVVGSEDVDAEFSKREKEIKASVTSRLDAGYLYGDGTDVSMIDPSILKDGHEVPAAYASYAGNAKVAELLDKNIDMNTIAGVDLSHLEDVLGTTGFTWGKVDDEFRVSKRGKGDLTHVTGGRGWGDVDVSGVDSLIIGMMQAEGTLTSGGVLGNSSGLTRGNHNKNPINIRAPHTAGYTDLVTAFQRENMGMDENSAGWGNLGPKTLEKMQTMGDYDPASFYNLDHAQRYWDGVTGVDDKGFAIFEDYESGWNAARQQVFSAMVRGDNINEYLNKHAPGFENDVGNVINTVASRYYKHVGPANLPDSTINYMNNQNLVPTPLITYSTGPDAYDLASAIDPSNADIDAVKAFQAAQMGMSEGDQGWGTFGPATTAAYREAIAGGTTPTAGPNAYDLASAIDPSDASIEAVQNFQAAQMGMSEGDQGWGTFGPATTAAYREAIAGGPTPTVPTAGPNAHDLASAIDPAAADINAVKEFQRVHMGLSTDDVGYGTFGPATTAAYQEVIANGADAYATNLLNVGQGVGNAIDNSIFLTSNGLQMTSATANTLSVSQPWFDTDSNAFKLLSDKDMTEMFGGGENAAVMHDYVNTLAAVFPGKHSATQAEYLTEFIMSMGATEARGGTLTGALVDLGLVNVSSDAAMQAEQGLFLEERAMDMYNTFMLPTHSDMRLKKKAVVADATQMKIIKDNKDALDNIQVDFEGAQIQALNTATEIMHNNGLLQNATDANEDGTINFADLQGTDMSSVRDFLYTGNQEVYEDLFMDLKGGTSVTEDVIGTTGGKGGFRELMQGEFFDKGTKSFDVQALDWWISEAEKTVAENRGTYELDEEGKATLLGKSGWMSHENLQNIDVNETNKLVSGGLIVGGIVLAPFTAGQSLWASGIGAASLAADIVADTWADSDATHVGKLLNLAFAEDMSTFNSKYQDQPIDFTDLDGASQLKIFSDMVLDNDMEFDNKFISQLKTIQGQTLEGQALWDASTQNYIDEAVLVAEDLRDQNQTNIESNAEYDLVVDKLNLARGMRAGLMDKQKYTTYGGKTANEDLSTFERVQGIKEQIQSEREQLRVDHDTGNYLADVIRDATRGVNVHNYRGGEGDSEDATYIKSFDEWAEMKKYGDRLGDGKVTDLDEERRIEYEDYVHTNRLTQGASKYGSAFQDAISDFDSGIYENAKQVQKEERELEKVREGALSEDETLQVAQINRQDIIISKLEQLIKKP